MNSVKRDCMQLRMIEDTEIDIRNQKWEKEKE
jgi:hypothetical protein